MRFSILLLICCCCYSATEIAVWQAGAGLIDGAAAEPGQRIASGSQIIGAADGPCRLLLLDTEDGNLTLSAGTSLRLRGEGEELICELATGTLQSDVPDLGPWQGYRVDGANAEVRVTGTIFVVKRRERIDHIAVVDGTVNVRLRKALADALGGKQEIDLHERQRVSASEQGLGAVVSQQRRPQLVKVNIGDDASWQLDAAAIMLGLRDAAESGINLADLQVAVADKNLAQGKGDILDDLQEDLLKEVIEEVIDSQTIIDEVLEQGGAAALDDLPSPPGG